MAGRQQPQNTTISIPVNDCVIPMYKGVLKDILNHGHTHYIGKGGRGSTKSSFYGGIAIPLLIVAYPTVNAVCFRKVGATIQNSIYSQVVWGIEKLGLTPLFHIPKIYSNPIVYKPTGQKIIFMGMDDPNKVKSIKVEKGYIGVTWWEELDQFAGENEMRKVLQSTMRGGKFFWNFMTFNPPISRNNWANEYAEDMKDRDGVLVTHNTYLDVPYEWLGYPFFEEAELLKARNERAYAHEYLGIAVGTGGDVFPNVCEFDADEVLENGSKMSDTFDRIYNGIDWGYAKDPTRFVRCHFDPSRLDLYIFREYSTHEKRNAEIFEELYNKQQLLSVTEPVIADSAEPKSIADFKAYGAFIRGATKGPESRRYGIKWLQGLNHIYIDRNYCPESFWEFSNYEYEQDKDGNFISQYPDGNDHSIDACLTGDTEVSTAYGSKRIEDMVGTEGYIRAYDIEHDRFILTPYCHCRKTYEVAEIYRVTLEDGRHIECTGNHRILTTSRGYVRADNLTADDAVVCEDDYEFIKNVEKTDIKRAVYDLEVPIFHNFVLSNGVVVHNCRYALEKYCNRKGN